MQARLDEHLQDLFPPQKRTLEDFNEHFQVRIMVGTLVTHAHRLMHAYVAGIPSGPAEKRSTVLFAARGSDQAGGVQQEEGGGAAPAGKRPDQATAHCCSFTFHVISECLPCVVCAPRSCAGLVQCAVLPPSPVV